MTPEAASLDRLRDIVEPNPVSWWPPAVGWWVSGTIVLFAAVVLGVRFYLRWQRDAYRRSALRELESAATPADVAVILKRVALCAFPRSNVASLSGDSWFHWLEEIGRTKLPEGLRRELSQGVYQATPEKPSNALVAFSRRWILQHQTSGEVSS